MASPYSSIISCFTTLFDTISAEHEAESFSMSLMEVRLCADLIKSSPRAENLAFNESLLAVTEFSRSRFVRISSTLAHYVQVLLKQ